MIDELYGCQCGCCNGEKVTDASEGIVIDGDLLTEIMQEIYNEEVDEQTGVSPTLFAANRDVFRRAIDEGYINSANKNIDSLAEFNEALRHSADVFALHRSAQQTALLTEAMIDSEGNLKDYDQWVKDTASINAHYNKAWLRTEYDTAVLRAQMAADWKQFEADADVLPNLKWMPTTSVTPREQHRVFWSEGLTLPIDDPFWNKHRPGDLWNCKCWLEQTDEPATAKKDLPKESEMPSPMPGLEGNPAKTEEIFSQDHPHFPTSCASCLLNTDGKVHGIKGVKNAGKEVIGICGNCKMAKDCVERIDKQCKSLPSIAPVIDRRMKEMGSQKERQKLLKEIQQNPEAEVIIEMPKAKTRIYEGCQGPESKSWKRTKKLASDLNKNGINVTFLAEHRDITCADAIIDFNGILVIADFKCSATKKPNTLFHDLEKGYAQASAVVLKLEKMDAGQFKDAIGQFLRKYEDDASNYFGELKIGKMILVNKYGKLLEFERKDFINSSYLKKIKGFL